VNPILEGQLVLAIPLALLAGLVAFASPCVLPLVPGYLGLVTSLAGEDGSRRRVLVGVLLFIAGFTAVFVLGNLVVGVTSEFLIRYRGLLIRILGVALIVMGLVFIGQFSWLQRVWKPAQVRSGGMWAAPVVGVVFAIGWSPCMGPTLAAIGALSLQSGTAWQAALLGFVYAMGLGLPFLAIALGFGWATKAVTWVRKHVRVINIVGGAMLIVLGVLMLTGVWMLASNVMQGWFASMSLVL
jgi:cytochrome c-type biogenesis protein